MKTHLLWSLRIRHETLYFRMKNLISSWTRLLKIKWRPRTDPMFRNTLSRIYSSLRICRTPGNKSISYVEMRDLSKSWYTLTKWPVYRRHWRRFSTVYIKQNASLPAKYPFHIPFLMKVWRGLDTCLAKMPKQAFFSYWNIKVCEHFFNKSLSFIILIILLTADINNNFIFSDFFLTSNASKTQLKLNWIEKLVKVTKTLSESGTSNRYTVLDDGG